ncbi:MAG: glycoside hydrolase family 5 protein [Chloroflexota bacterium]
MDRQRGGVPGLSRGSAIAPRFSLPDGFSLSGAGTTAGLRLALSIALVAGLLTAPAGDNPAFSCAPAFAAAQGAAAPAAPPSANDEKQFGVGIGGGEFTASRLPGTLGTDYLYPADRQRLEYFARHGLTLVRLPFLWERIQPEPFGPLSAKDVAGLRAVLDAAAANHQSVILDLHDYGRYYDKPLTTADAARFADVWGQLAQAMVGQPGLFGYELMNEPHDLPGGSATWASLAQVATNAIRDHDRTAWVLVPGYGWQSASQWPANNPTLDVRDPTGRLLYAAHDYFDRDGSGTYARSYAADGATPCTGVDRLRPFLEWLNRRDARGILTEYGVPADDPRWLDVLDRFLAALEASPRIAGGTYWPAGPWWGSYPLSVEPTNGHDRPQAAILFRYPSK